jgi:hypothetical protein
MTFTFALQFPLLSSEDRHTGAGECVRVEGRHAGHDLRNAAIEAGRFQRKGTKKEGLALGAIAGRDGGEKKSKDG